MIGRLGILCERIERLVRYMCEANILKNKMADTYGVT